MFWWLVSCMSPLQSLMLKNIDVDCSEAPAWLSRSSSVHHFHMQILKWDSESKKTLSVHGRSPSVMYSLSVTSAGTIQIVEAWFSNIIKISIEELCLLLRVVFDKNRDWNLRPVFTFISWRTSVTPHVDGWKVLSEWTLVIISCTICILHTSVAH